MRAFPLGLAAVFTLVAVRADEPKPDDPAADPKVAAVDLIQQADALADLGRRAKAPEALLAAAGILYRVPPSSLLKAEVQSGSGSAVEAGTLPSLRAEADALLAEAKALAKDDPAVVALADAIAARKVTRGAAGGPRMGRWVLSPGDHHTHKIPVVGKEPFTVLVAGAGNTPLRAVVSYTGAGNKVTVLSGVGVAGAKAFVPPANGTVTVTITNPNKRAATAYRVATN